MGLDHKFDGLHSDSCLNSLYFNSQGCGEGFYVICRRERKYEGVITILNFVNTIFKLRGWVLVVGAAQNFINWTVRKVNGINTTKQKFSP